MASVHTVHPTAEGRTIKVAVAGKTGSGKTTVSALLALSGAAGGRRTLAVDTDVNPNLGLSLGLGHEAVESARAVPRALVSGRGGGSVTTSQVIRGYGLVAPSGVTLLHAMPRSDEPGGCCCPAHASARGLLASVLDDEANLTVIDLEAGLDHLERSSGTVAHVDRLVVVVEPSRKSEVTAARTVALARAHGIEGCVLVANKGDAGDGDVAGFTAVARRLGVPLAGTVPHTPGIADADRAGAGLSLAQGGLGAAVGGILGSLA